jgi:hypothetical protein
MKYYLDASPMIRALSESPSEFEMEGNFVRHKPSRHVLKFDVHGNAQLVARCNCSQLPISQQQSDELRAAVAAWMDVYWRPLMARQAAERRVGEINRAFGEHFRPRGILRRTLDAVLSFIGPRPSGFARPGQPRAARGHGISGSIGPGNARTGAEGAGFGVNTSLSRRSRTGPGRQSSRRHATPTKGIGESHAVRWYGFPEAVSA